MPRPVLDFWFDFASTYSYLAAMRIGPLAQKAVSGCASARSCSDRFSRRRAGPPRRSTSIRPRAVICGATSSARSRSCSYRSGVPIPFRKIVCSRPAWRLRDSTGWGEDFCRALFRAEFADGRRIDDAAAIGDVLVGLNIDPEPALAAARSDAIKARLRAQTEEAQRLGLF